MIKKVLHFSFLVPVLLFLIHQILQKGFQLQIPFIDSYLDPFCLGALAVPLIQLERRIIFKQTHLPLFELIIIAIVLIAISEFLLPLMSESFIADPWDAVFIIMGIGWFLIFNPISVNRLLI